MTMQNILLRNRVVLTHFDSYSTALVFPRWGATLLWPAALPEAAWPMPVPALIDPIHASESVRLAVVQRLGLNPGELESVGDFNHWAQTPDGPVRIHLLRFTALDAPKAAIEALGGEFKPMSMLRGSAMGELVLLREVYNLIVGGGRG